jgi:2-methylcitrate dehydratase PrpD
MSAQLAQRGLTSGDQVMEHPFGFAATVLGEGIYDLDEMAENLGKPYRTQDALVIKKYPCCGGNHAILDSLFSLMREHNFTYQDVANAEVDQSYYSVVMLYQEPEDPLKAKFSAKYNVAAAMVDGEVGIETFRDEKIADQNLQRAMGKVRTRVLSKSEESTTDLLMSLPIRITLNDGRVFEHTTGREEILGAQNNPWGFDNIKEKFRVNANLALPEDEAGAAIEAWSDIPQVTDLAGTIQRTLVKNGG